MVKKWLADLIPQRFIASVYSWDNWIQEDRERERERIERFKRVNGETGELRSKMGGFSWLHIH